ncbi:hypothetical protein F511_33580 [Dorcoceras hygrometricum]|uniref:Uncharacterized protein n=1 Tax=Dorcoceras hygrometricum TaxID=472368 RepID=A0A2Z7AP76_9LAMI|nr:hypothetical protein F511_33580 [Dorcoceras hygrometricum]
MSGAPCAIVARLNQQAPQPWSRGTRNQCARGAARRRNQPGRPPRNIAAQPLATSGRLTRIIAHRRTTGARRSIAVDNRQSGPRPEPRLLRQASLEALTNSARTDSPRRTGRKQISAEDRRRRVGGGGGGVCVERREAASTSTYVTLNGSGIQLAVGPQPLWLRNHNSGPAQRIMVKRLATSSHDPLGITDSACKNQSIVVSVQYGPFNPYIPIRSTTIGKSRVAIDSIAMHTSWRSE